MAKKTRAELKAFFETGDKPTQQQFADFIDSVLNLIEQSQVDATIIVNVPVLGTGAGGKILKRGNAIIQMGEYSDDDIIISSDNGTWTTGATIYIGNTAIDLSIYGFSQFIADATRTRLGFNTDNIIILNTIGGRERMNLYVKDDLMLGQTGARLSFFNVTPTHGRQTITGSKGGNVALGNLLTALDNLNLIIDNTT